VVYAGLIYLAFDRLANTATGLSHSSIAAI
jgi:hypothetical protein